MKSYLLLLKLNLTNLLAGLRGGSFRKQNGKLDVSRIIVMITAVISVAVLAGMLLFLEWKLYGVMSGIRMEKLLIGLVFLMSMVMTLLFGVIHTLATMYFGRDSVSLAHLPVSSRAIMAAKWTEIYLPEIGLSAVFLLPLSIFCGIDTGAGALYYLRAVGLIVTAPLYPLATALLLSSLLGRMTSLTKHKEVWGVIGTVALLVIVIGAEWFLLPSIPADADAMFFLRLLMDNEALMQMIIGAFPPVMWAVHALSGSWAEWALFLLVGAAAMAAILYLLGGSYLAVCLRHTEQGTRRRRAAKGKRSYQVRSPLMAIFWREVNEAVKVPVYLLNGVLGSLMMPIILGGASVGFISTPEGAALLPKMQELLQMISPFDLTLILAALFAFNCWITPIISTSVSREGQRLPITRMIPVRPRTILNAKLLCGMSITFAGTAVVVVALAVLMGAKWLPHLLAAFAMAMLLCYASSVVNLAIDTSRPMLNWKNETQVMKQNMNQVIGMLLSTVMIALLAVPAVLLFKRGALVRFGAVAAVLAAEVGLAFLLMRKFIEPRYASLEP